MTTQISSSNIQQSTLNTLSGPRITSFTITNSSWVTSTATGVATTGGYMVITGTGFSSPMTVYFSGTSASTVTYVNSTTLRVVVPALSASTYVVTAQDSSGGTATSGPGLVVAVTPVWVTTSPLTNGIAGSAYSVQLNATNATTYSLLSGTLPTGLTLSSSGLLSGTPSVGNTYNFTINATNGANISTSQAFALTIVDADFNISPAVSGVSDWKFTTNGNLNIGTNGTYTVTPYANLTFVTKMWGAGGGGCNQGISTGGGGGYSTGNISITTGNTYTLVIGERGYYMYIYNGNASTASYQSTNVGGGGKTAGISGSGGGYSGIFIGTASQANAILIAGGGGGAGGAGGVVTSGGAGGGSSGLNGTAYAYGAGTGGSQVAGGTGPGSTNGSALLGGFSFASTVDNGGAGGGGYYGGGASRADSNNSGSGGGGGSGYVRGNLITNGSTTAGSGGTPGNSADSNRGTAGNGGVQAAGVDGRIYISKG